MVCDDVALTMAPMQHTAVHRIEIPTPYEVGPVNAYLIDAEPLTLIDAGINTDDGRQAFLDGITRAGRSPDQVERVLVTHAHPDHYGLVHVLQEAGDPAVYFPAREILRVRDRQMLFETGRLLVQAGMPLELLMKMDEARKSNPRPKVRYEDLVSVDDGDRFGFADGSELVALFMPGHTGGHIVYLDRASRIAFAGDQLLPETSPNPLLEPSLDEPGERRRSLREYLDSLERLDEIGIEVAYPGHGDVVTDPHALIRRTIEHHAERKDAIAERLSADAKTPYELAREFYPHVDDYGSFLAVSEVVAHLDLVVEEGRAAVEEREGVTYYRAAEPVASAHGTEEF